MDKFVWIDTTSGRSSMNLADISVICFNEYEKECTIHLRSGTIFTATMERGNALLDSHEAYNLSLEDESFFTPSEDAWDDKDLDCVDCGGIVNPHPSRGPYTPQHLCDCEGFVTECSHCGEQLYGDLPCGCKGANKDAYEMEV